MSTAPAPEPAPEPAPDSHLHLLSRLRHCPWTSVVLQFDPSIPSNHPVLDFHAIHHSNHNNHNHNQTPPIDRPSLALNSPAKDLSLSTSPQAPAPVLKEFLVKCDFSEMPCLLVLTDGVSLYLRVISETQFDKECEEFLFDPHDKNAVREEVQRMIQPQRQQRQDQVRFQQQPPSQTEAHQKLHQDKIQQVARAAIPAEFRQEKDGQQTLVVHFRMHSSMEKESRHADEEQGHQNKHNNMKNHNKNSNDIQHTTQQLDNDADVMVENSDPVLHAWLQWSFPCRQVDPSSQSQSFFHDHLLAPALQFNQVLVNYIRLLVDMVTRKDAELEAYRNKRPVGSKLTTRPFFHDRFIAHVTRDAADPSATATHLGAFAATYFDEVIQVSSPTHKKRKWGARQR